MNLKKRRHKWPKPSSAGTRGNATPDQCCLACGMERNALRSLRMLERLHKTP